MRSADGRAGVEGTTQVGQPVAEGAPGGDAQARVGQAGGDEVGRGRLDHDRGEGGCGDLAEGGVAERALERRDLREIALDIRAQDVADLIPGAAPEAEGELEPLVLDAIRGGDTVTVKGSLGTRMGPIVKAILARFPAVPAED